MKNIIDLSLNAHVFESLSRFNDPKLIKLRLRGQGSCFYEALVFITIFIIKRPYF